jgi:hypothetical protein
MKNKPYSSPLWEHVDLIVELRLKRASWNAIADLLKAEHGVQINYRSVQSFFKRLLVARVLPLGWAPKKVPPPKMGEPDKWPTKEEAESLLR